MDRNRILDEVKSYNEKGFSRFHMPGHKGNCHELSRLVRLENDLTEVTGLDSLFEASSCILETEKEIARLYGAKRSLISAEGSSQAIKTMLSLALKEGETVIMSRNAHGSAINALALLGIKAFWIYPEGEDKNGLSGVYGEKSVRDALESCPYARAVYITSPNYFGLVSDIEGIARACKERGIPLLVDNAHGASLILEKENLHPINLGATMTADSFHKTLPSLTGSAVLHIADEKYISSAKEKMTVFSSTSPSYLIMESMDYAVSYLKGDAKKHYLETAEKISGLKKIAKNSGFRISEGKGDSQRLNLILESSNYSSESFLDYLHSFKLEPELVCDYGACFMASEFNSKEDFARLRSMLENCDIKYIEGEQAPPSLDEKTLREAVSLMTVREAFFLDKEELLAEEAVGRICGQFVCPCPPGIPLAIPGEKITENLMKLFLIYGIKRVNVVK